MQKTLQIMLLNKYRKWNSRSTDNSELILPFNKVNSSYVIT